ncbi:hypothetical protein [Vibrio caribbeanicus]|uniref:Uncharacterized protein n=1 Tax=Vibrio caribbeanicus ATCC BAA-2122 TaxID=796620 RepID=E3BI10_9VIBR|nr:hypothetical protein [Vibrio caribbeanicus]EFP97449.1 hypothetical protein VIBC2010_18699 [Vibrio caribbeanicus ATCC BAA-2122]
MEKEILGYITCRTCMTPKAIIQGSGKRKEYVYGRCECGVDNRTGSAAQSKMKGFKSIEEIQAEIEALNQPKPELKPEPQSEPKPVVNQPQPDTEPKPMGTAACVGIGAVTGFVLGGVFKVLKAVA